MKREVYALGLCVGVFVFLGVAGSGFVLAGEFSRWRGTDSNGSAGEPAMPLAQSLDEVRLARVSETLSPHPWNFSVVRGYTAWPRRVLGNGGYCMPAVADGKVYVGYWRPTGTVEAEKGDGKYPSMWVNSGLKAYRLIDADMVIVCMDGKTGTNIWEAVWHGTEMNHVELYGTHNNICATTKIQCLDPTTGKILWTAGELGNLGYSEASAADGFVYFRSGEQLVAALDVRKDATSHAQIELTLADALGPNAPARSKAGTMRAKNARGLSRECAGGSVGRQVVRACAKGWGD